MKKLLTILSVGAIIGFYSSKTISCGAENIIESLDSSNSSQKLGKFYYLNKWSDDVITSDSYKKYYSQNLISFVFGEDKEDGQAFITNFSELFENVKIKNPYNNKEIEKSVPIVYYQMLEYEWNSNTQSSESEFKKPTNSDDFEAVLDTQIDLMEKYFNVNFYGGTEEAHPDKPDQEIIKHYDYENHKWVDEEFKPNKIMSKVKGDSEGEYISVVTFYIGIEVTKEGSSKNFIGNRNNVFAYSSLEEFEDKEKYSINKTFGDNFSNLDFSKKPLDEFAIEKKGKWYFSNSFDYRYKIQFSFKTVIS